MRFNIFPEITSESVLGYGTRVTLACSEKDSSKHACTHVLISHTQLCLGVWVKRLGYPDQGKDQFVFPHGATHVW